MAEFIKGKEKTGGRIKGDMKAIYVKNATQNSEVSGGELGDTQASQKRTTTSKKM